MRYAAALSHCLLHRLLEEAKRVRLQAIPFRKALLTLGQGDCVEASFSGYAVENDEKIVDLENALAELKKAMERFEELSVAESKKVHQSLEVQSEDVVALDGRINSWKAEIRKAVSDIDFLRERLEAMKQRVDVLDEANREKAAKIAELEKRVCRCGEKEVTVGSKSSPIVIEETEADELEYLDNDSFQTAPEVRSAMADGVLVPIKDEEHNKENVSCDGPATCSCRRVRYEILAESSESVSTPATP